VVIFKEPRTILPQDRLAWFRVMAARLQMPVPNAYPWKWCK
jgi:hypothetical protein